MIAIPIKDQMTFREFETMNWLNIQRTLQKWSVRKKSDPLPLSDITEAEFLNFLFYLIIHAYDKTIKNAADYDRRQDYYQQWHRLFQPVSNLVLPFSGLQNRLALNPVKYVNSRNSLPMAQLTSNNSTAIQHYGNYLTLYKMDSEIRNTRAYCSYNNYSQEIIRQRSLDLNDLANQSHLLFFIGKISKVIASLV